MLLSGYFIRFGILHNTNGPGNMIVFKFLLTGFFLLLYVFYNYKIGKIERLDILDLLWKVFVTGLVATIISLSLRFLLTLLEDQEHGHNLYLIDTIYLIHISLILAFLLANFFIIKKLILYQKSKNLVKVWNIFEYGLLISLVFFFIRLNNFQFLFQIVLGIFILLGIILSVNLKWVAYLNFKQKWKSILLNILITLYLFYFFITLVRFSDNNDLFLDVLDNVTIISLFVFTFIYTVFSFLVILFNLPTSSVFEKKLEEVISFQKLSQSRNIGQKEDQIYEILLESAASSVMASAAWLEIYDQKTDSKKTIYIRITEDRKERILDLLSHHKFLKSSETDYFISLTGSKLINDCKDAIFKSLLLFPIYIQQNQIGTLVLLKDLQDGFNREMVEIIGTFVSQASISIENFRLLEEAIRTERYMEELKIAKRVQDSLLPSKLAHNSDFEISAYSKAAAEVGGDYYDSLQIADGKVAVIIGDVSGKGTSAAFHMSQMKGIFHSLFQLNLNPRDFIIKSNNALSNCLDRTSFITTSIFIFDEHTKTVEFSRAGHCPTLFYSSKDKKVIFYEDSGLGLGILRDEQFDAFVEVNKISYNPGDIIFLYTDGIIEAKDEKNEEFGYDRLKDYLEANASKGPKELEEGIMELLFDFCGSNVLSDDFTTLIVKFK